VIAHITQYPHQEPVIGVVATLLAASGLVWLEKRTDA
jgi:hypothetical protein